MPRADLLFGAFRLCVSRRLLLEDGRRVRLGERAFDILHALVEGRGALVTNEEIVRRAWNDTNVDDRALRVHLSALRKVLGEGRTAERAIVNVPGQGYCFVVPVTAEEEAPPPLLGLGSPALRITHAIGRDAVIARVVAELPKSRFVSVVGPGGVGKTTVAVMVAEVLADAYPDGVFMAELVSLENPALLPSTLASLLGLGSYSEDPVPGILAFLRPRKALIVLDNCEHLVAAAAAIAERLLAAAPGVHLLATSREPLRAAGEWVRRLEPLDREAAAQLFVERARASATEFELTSENTQVIARLCEQLDGLPLAIELAAARVPEIGLRGLERGLKDRFEVLTRGLRTALPRHQTLRAMLDWSYELLGDAERTALRRLAVFASDFGLVEAAKVANDVPRLAEVVSDLVAKSLVTVDLTGEHEVYRLLETTRQYGREQLLATGESEAVARLHTEACLVHVARAKDAWKTLSAVKWKQTYGPWIADVRASLAWAAADHGDPALLIRMTSETFLLWTQLALMEEYREHVERALAVNAARATPDLGVSARLEGVLGNLLYHTKGADADALSSAAFERSLVAARAVNDRESELFAHSGGCAVATRQGDYVAGLAFAERLDETLGLAGKVAKDRALAHVLHYLGDFARCQKHLDASVADFLDAERIRTSGVAFDHQVTIRSVQARVHWLMGRPDQAIAMARECVEYARTIDHGISLCLTLAVTACPLHFLVGGRSAAAPYLELLRDTAVKHSILRWGRYVDFYDIAMTPAAERNGLAMDALAQTPIDGPVLENCAVVGDDYVDDRIAERAAAGSGEWCRAELLRREGQRLLHQRQRARAEERFAASLALARQQGTRAWELRTATSFARSLRDRGRAAEAEALLAPVHAAFTEGRGSTDVRLAEELLASLR